MIAREPLPTRKLAQLAGLEDGTRARTLIRKLNQRYDSEGRAFRVVEVGGGFLTMTRPQFAPWLRRLHGTQQEIRLSGPAMETLAVVAYRQPVLRADIEAIRGVQCGEMLRQLMERDLVKISGRSEELGRPFLYGTTKYFLQVFGLRHLEGLPRLDQFSLSQTILAQSQKNTEEIPVTITAETEPQTSTPPEDELLLTESEPLHAESEDEDEEEYEYVYEDVEDDDFDEEDEEDFEEDDEEEEEDGVEEEDDVEEEEDDDEEDEDDYEYYDDEEDEEEECEDEDEDDDEEDEDIWEEVEDDDEGDDEDVTWEEEWEYEDEEDEEDEDEEDEDEEEYDDDEEDEDDDEEDEEGVG